MTEYANLRELEDAQAQVSAAARERLAQSEECVDMFRTGMRNIQERFHDLAAHYGVADDPGFRAVLQQLSEQTDANVGRAAYAIQDAEAEVMAMESRHDEERERFLRERRTE